jgi:pSer/pThr/pTyr-binding forkhead associated (FHA) protein
MGKIKYCQLCGRNVYAEREFNWLVFIFFLGIFYLPFYFLKPERCPICKSTQLTPVQVGEGPSPLAVRERAQLQVPRAAWPVRRPAALAAPTAMAVGVQLASDPRYQAGFQGNILNIGRDPSNEMVISDSQASRFHARITMTPNGYVIEDLGSANGTYVNGHRITRAALPVGAQIRIGHSHLHFRG